MELSVYYIDLSKYSIKNIKQIAESNSLEDIDLYSLKVKGYNKIWLNARDISIIATSKARKNKIDAISLTKEFKDKITSMSCSTRYSKHNDYKNLKISKVFKFDLTSDLKYAKSICEKYNISYETLTHNKEKNLRKIWLYNNGEGIVYYENAGHECVVSSYFIDDLRKCNEWELCDSNKIILDVDIILDKISAYGIDTLTKEELEFLDTQ